MASPVPSLRSLCASFIDSAILNLDNAIDGLSLARAHELPSLAARAEAFIVDAWTPLIERHGLAALTDALGKERAEELCRHHEEMRAQVERNKLLGTVLPQPAPPLTAQGQPARWEASRRSAGSSSSPPPGEEKAASPLTPRGGGGRVFGGGGTKCCRCGTTVYRAEEVCAHARSFHKRCFRCRQCDASLTISSYQMDEDGTIFCRVHFAQVVSARGGTSRPVAAPTAMAESAADKSPPSDRGCACARCGKQVYMCEMATAKSHRFHQSCFRCTDCGIKLRVGNWELVDEQLVCYRHFEERQLAKMSSAAAE
ncbi:hypothetical protein AB1Y20_018265 [Prymnesium parvum]|uniref:LIM zinc-binding domain-containing protein n=1 Tax=Prymnesium parvum TaxID=97485 RepID=A0AB34JMZ6_PRYPA